MDEGDDEVDDVSVLVVLVVSVLVVKAEVDVVVTKEVKVLVLKVEILDEVETVVIAVVTE